MLVAGWGDQNFMIALLHSMEQELPKDSQVTLLNLRPKEQVLGAEFYTWHHCMPHERVALIGMSTLDLIGATWQWLLRL